MKIQRCEGKRRQFRRGSYGVFKCMRKATGTVTTNVGFSKTHPCCGDDQCYSSIAGGYPANWTPYEK